MATMLKDAGAAINVANQGGDTPLLAAVAAGNLELVKLLVRAGANLAARNKAGYTSVELAVEQKHEATVEVLLEAIVAAGMDIDARYESRREQGQTLLMRSQGLAFLCVPEA
jgi:ankyrin repeat protein